MKRNRLSLRKGPSAAPATTKPPLFVPLVESKGELDGSLDKNAQHKKPRSENTTPDEKGLQKERGILVAKSDRVARSSPGAFFDEDCRESFGLVSSGKSPATARGPFQSKDTSSLLPFIPSPDKPQSPKHETSDVRHEEDTAPAPTEAVQPRVASPHPVLVSSLSPQPTSPCLLTTNTTSNSPTEGKSVSASNRHGAEPDLILVVSTPDTPPQVHTSADAQAERDERARAEGLSLWQRVFWPQESTRVVAPYKPLPGFVGGELQLAQPPPPPPTSTAAQCFPPPAHVTPIFRASANQGPASTVWKPLPFANYRIHPLKPAPLVPAQQPETMKITPPPNALPITRVTIDEPPLPLSSPLVTNVDTDGLSLGRAHTECDSVELRSEFVEAQPVESVSRKSKKKDEDSGYMSAKRRKASAQHVTEHTGAGGEQQTKTYEPLPVQTAVSERTSTPVRQVGVGNAAQPNDRRWAANTRGNEAGLDRPPPKSPYRRVTNVQLDNDESASVVNASGKNTKRNHTINTNDELPWPHETSGMSSIRPNTNTRTEILADVAPKQNNVANGAGSVYANRQPNHVRSHAEIQSARTPDVSRNNVSGGEQTKSNRAPEPYAASGAKRKVSPYSTPSAEMQNSAQSRTRPKSPSKPNRTPASHTVSGAKRKPSPYSTPSAETQNSLQSKTRPNSALRQPADFATTNQPHQLGAVPQGNTPRGTGPDGRKVKQATLTPGGLIKEKKSQQCPICGNTLPPGLSNQQLNDHINDCLQASGMVD